MPYRSRNTAVLFASFFSVIIFIVLFFTFNFFRIVFQTSYLVVLFLLLFTCSYFLFLFVSRLFIYTPVKKITDTIRSYRTATEKKEEEQVSANINVIAELNEQVTGWADDRKNEIEQLKKLENYRKEYLGNVSHELKTPIFNIQGYISTLLDGGLEDPSINKDYLVRAEKSVDRMISIIADLEAISQLETGQLEIEPERFDIAALAKDIFESQEMKATAKGIMLRLKEEDEKHFYVHADKFRIRQVLTNLIVNSINYGKEYGETKIKFYDTGENIVVEVADNGMGIEKEHLPRIFERFYRVDKSRSRDQGGTGLGLAIVKHIIEAHGQTINVMSTQGVGTVFSFTLKKG